MKHIVALLFLILVPPFFICIAYYFLATTALSPMLEQGLIKKNIPYVYAVFVWIMVIIINFIKELLKILYEDE